MQSLNDDMDRLFRRAAEGYPLDTGSADWDKVQSMLAQDTAVVKPTGNDRRKLLWLLLLLPLGFLCNRYVYDGFAHLQNELIGSRKTEAGSKREANSTVQQNRSIESKRQELGGRVNNVRLQEKSILEKPTVGLSHSSGFNDRVANNTGSTYIYNNSRTALGKIGNDLAIKPVTTSPGEDLNANHRFRNTTPLRSILTPSLFLYNTWPLNPVFAQGKNQDKKHQQKNVKHFYAGLMGGLDATSIKLQKVDALGYSAGVLLGYDLGRKWSIETGLFMDKKFYYTKGEYFNKSHLYMPSYYSLTSVTGNCRMWEIPVTAKYTIRQTATSSFFTTAGASSYIMKREAYDYDYKNTTTGQEGSYYKSYTNSSRKFFSVVHLSAGYSLQLGRIGDLRIEPYLKIPVQKVGVGQMPITSAGLQVGMTRKLF